MRTIHDVAPDEREAFIRRAMANQAMTNMALASSGRFCRPALTASAATVSLSATVAVPSPPKSTQPKAKAHFPVSDREGSDARALEVSVHEAAHACVGTLLGAQVRDAEIVRGGSRSNPGVVKGWCHFSDFGVAPRAHRAVIAAAGAVGQAVFRYGAAPTGAQISALLAGSDDGKELLQLALTASAAEPSPTRQALPLVLTCWPAICSLAVRLEARSEFTYRDVVSAMGLSKDHTRHPFEVANIAAGMRPIPDPRARRTRAAL